MLLEGTMDLIIIDHFFISWSLRFKYVYLYKPPYMNGTLRDFVFMQLQVFCLEHTAETNNIWRGFITPEFRFHI